MEDRNLFEQARKDLYENVALKVSFNTITILAMIIVLFIIGYVVVNIGSTDSGSATICFLGFLMSMFAMLVFNKKNK